MDINRYTTMLFSLVVLVLLILSTAFVLLEQSPPVPLSVTITVTNTANEIVSETATEYITHLQTLQATGIATDPPPGTINHYQTVTSTRTVIKVETIPQRAAFLRNYILVGGQNGSWFTPSQYPRLLQIFPDTASAKSLLPVAGQGTVWSGEYNGYNWLLSGWGIGYAGGTKANPYLYVYDGVSQVNNSVEDSAEAEWAGGDVFAISSNATGWLLSGMGSGPLTHTAVNSGRHRVSPNSNHLSMGFYDGSTFTDFSAKLPEQMDGILYANAYNGSVWLVGGGYLSRGVLFLFEGRNFVDLTAVIKRSIPSFASVESIAWNGHYWLLGGLGFLAEYDGSKFTDLTPNLKAALKQSVPIISFQSVNALSWSGTAWMLGGGEPVAVDTVHSSPWLATYTSSNFTDLTLQLPSYATRLNSSSSILSIARSDNGRYWLVGGYSETNHAMLLKYEDQGLSDLSNMTGDMSYVNWVAITG